MTDEDSKRGTCRAEPGLRLIVRKHKIPSA